MAHKKETIEKLIKASIKSPVVQLTKTGILIAIHNSIMEAYKETGVNRTDIIRCCKAKYSHYTAGGFRWRYTKDVDIERLIRESNLI